MKVIICVDEEGGIAFNNRRQSRDSAVIRDITELADGERIWVLPYTAKLFGEDSGACLKLSDTPLKGAARRDGLCFAELTGMGEYARKIDTLIIYNWNRIYPSDVRMDVAPEALGLKLAEVKELVGTSHEKITREIYR